MPDISTHTRVLDTITGPVEKRVLRWLAERTPRWVTPDVLTAIGLLGSAVVFAGYVLSYRASAYLWLANAGILINWLGDSLDGTLARVRHIERPKYGFYLDHTIDVVSEGLVILGIGASPFVHFQIAAAAYVGYLMVSVLTYVRMAVDGVFKISYSRFGPTELRLVLIAFNAALYFTSPLGPFGEQHGLGAADFVVGGVAIALVAAFVISAIKGAIELRDVDKA